MVQRDVHSVSPSTLDGNSECLKNSALIQQIWRILLLFIVLKKKRLQLSEVAL